MSQIFLTLRALIKATNGGNLVAVVAVITSLGTVALAMYFLYKLAAHHC